MSWLQELINNYKRSKNLGSSFLVCVLARGQTESLQTLFGRCPSQIPNWLLTWLTERQNTEICNQCRYFSAAQTSPGLNTSFLKKNTHFSVTVHTRKRERQRESMHAPWHACGGGQWTTSRNWICPTVWGEDQTVSSLGNKHFYPTNHLSNPKYISLSNFKW